MMITTLVTMLKSIESDYLERIRAAGGAKKFFSSCDAYDVYLPPANRNGNEMIELRQVASAHKTAGFQKAVGSPVAAPHSPQTVQAMPNKRTAPSKFTDPTTPLTKASTTKPSPHSPPARVAAPPPSTEGLVQQVERVRATLEIGPAFSIPATVREANRLMGFETAPDVSLPQQVELLMTRLGI